MNLNIGFSKKVIFLFSLIALTCTFGCQHKSKQSGDLESSQANTTAPTYLQWELKSLIKNTTTGEASIVTLDMVGAKLYPLRAEISTSVGLHMASVVIQENDIQYILPRSKRYFYGPISQKSLSPVLNVKLDPRLIQAALFDLSFPDWKCTAENGLILNCETSVNEKISWDRQPNKPKLVNIKGQDYEVQIQFISEKVKSEIKENTFSLKVPESYKKIKL